MKNKVEFSPNCSSKWKISLKLLLVHMLAPLKNLIIKLLRHLNQWRRRIPKRKINRASRCQTPTISFFQKISTWKPKFKIWPNKLKLSKIGILPYQRKQKMVAAKFKLKMRHRISIIRQVDLSQMTKTFIFCSRICMWRISWIRVWCKKSTN